MSPQFEIGDLVYLKTDPEQYRRIITGVITRPGAIMYCVGCGEIETVHYAFELTDTKELQL